MQSHRRAGGFALLPVLFTLVCGLRMTPPATAGSTPDSLWTRELAVEWLARTDSLFRADRLPAADSLAQATVRLVEASAPIDSSLVARALARVAMVSTRSPEARVREVDSELRSAGRLSLRWLGVESEESAWSHLALARLAEFDRNPELARRHVEEAIRVRERLFGADAEPVARALVPLANLERAAGNYAGAHAYLQRALTIYRARLGERHVTTASTYGQLSQLESLRGDFKAALDSAERSLALRTELLGAEHKETGNALFAVAVAASRVGQVERAFDAIRRAREIFSATYGEDSIYTVTALGVEADVLQDLGDYGAARRLHGEVLRRKVALTGEEHPGVAVTQNNLSIVLIELGQYEEAFVHLSKSAEILRALGGDDNPELVSVYNNLAVLQSMLGDDLEAARWAALALALCERLPGGMDTDRAVTYATLASTYSEIGRYAAADSMMARAQAVVEAGLGSEDAELGDLLNLRAEIAYRHGRLSEARRFATAGVELLARRRGAQSISTLVEAGDLVDILIAAGDLPAAQERQAGIADLLIRVLGQRHPEVARARYREALLLASEGETGRALSRALEAEEARRAHLRLTIESMPERQALAYAADPRRGLDLALALAAATPTTTAQRTALWESVASSRGLVLDALARRARAAAGAQTEAAADTLWRRLQTTRRTWARLLVADGVEVAELREAQRQAEEAERAWAAENHDESRSGALVSIDAIGAALPEGAALVAFARYELPASALPALPVRPGTGRIDRAGYVAFVLPGRAVAPSLVSLGAAGSIDSLVASWRRAVTRDPSGSGEAEAVRAGTALRERIWDPVRQRFGSAEQVWLISDGALHLINFDALPRPEGGYLVESSPLLHLLSEERELAPEPSAESSELHSGGLLALGDLDYDGDPNARPEPPTGAATGLLESLGARLRFRGAFGECAGWRSTHFEPLPETGPELDGIERTWRASGLGPIERLEGGSGTEGRLKERVPGARVVHLATHGFVRGADCTEGGQDEAGSRRGIGRIAAPAVPVPEPPARSGYLGAGDGSPREEAIDRQDLLRFSGLALAGANQRGLAPPDGEDGVLTAEELATLDLSAAEWVVLSGCDTGVGDLRAGEGVFGLRRAIRIAGARTGILSLWPVEDAATRDLMERLYRHRWLDHQSTAEALRSAERGILAARRAGGHSTHPFYWASFIASGR
ncbi:MAG: CHAT domain-containing protein [Candidatus Eisenbacteria bacterium]|nr:CHAT domain-containing protein [Candidatus Eisenbacteria bacterium]